MKYNFDKIVDRKNTDSMKWDRKTLKERFNNPDALPLWVADMDFEVALPIKEAIIKRAEHNIYGYSYRPDTYYDSIVKWVKDSFDWNIEKEWIKYTPGIVPAISYAIQAFCEKGDKILIQKPVYYPFKECVENNDCEVINNELVYDGETYTIDFADFEKKIKDVKMFILCSPHNPVSKVWKREDLEKMARLCKENDVIIISDEIHSDLVYDSKKFTAFGKLGKEYYDNLIVCMAPSKTFNIASMQSSQVIIPNETLREGFQNALNINNIGLQNSLSIVATEAAYNHGREWLDQLKEYLWESIEFMKDYLKLNLPKAKMIEPEATYLIWVDFSAYESDGKKLEKLIYEKAGVGLNGGSWFGENSDAFMRFNIACPKSILEEALEKISKVLNDSIK